MAFFFFDQLRESGLPADLPVDIYERLDRLAEYCCEVRKDINHAKNSLEKQRPKPAPRRQKSSDFDLRQIVTFQLFRVDSAPGLQPAYQIARLFEVTGLPSMGNIRLGGWEKLLTRAAEWLISQAGRAETLFRKKYLSSPSDGDGGESELKLDFLINISNATTGRSGVLQVSGEETQILWQRIKAWLRVALQAPQENDVLSELVGKSDIPKVVVRIMATVIFPCQTVPAGNFVREAWSVIEGLRDLKAPVEWALPEFLRLDPSRFMEVTEWLRQSSASLDPGPAKAAVSAIYYWLKGGPRLEIEPVPADLVREIALAIATRRPSNILFALELATSMIEERYWTADEGFTKLLTVGLRYLLEEARYDRLDQDDPDNTENVERLRFYCVKMALALEKSGFGGSSPAVAEWLEQAALDPMVAIRNLVSSRNAAPHK